MSSFDLILIIIIGLSSLVGAFRGFFSSLLSSFGWIVSLYGNHKLFYTIEPLLQAKLGSKFLTFIIGYLGGLLIFLLFFALVNFLANAFLSRFKLGFFDKILGGFFGFARGLVIIAFAFFTLDQGLIALVGDKLQAQEMPNFLGESVALPWMREGELIIAKYFPQEEHTKKDHIKILKIIAKLTSTLPVKETEELNAKINKLPLSKDERITLKLQKLWSLYKEEGKKSLSEEEIDFIKKITK
jgi:membrane protein required for colicin V production